LHRVQGIRKLVFDTAPPNRLFVASESSEIFVVSCKDTAIGRRLYSKGSCEFEKLEKTLRLLGPDRTNKLLIDIGANIGIICIPAIKRGIFRSAIAFEPEPFNFALLTSNVFLNGVSNNIRMENIALGSKDGEELLFELSEINYGDHRIRVGESSGLYAEDERSVIKVKSESLSKVIGDVNPNETLIWMDTQGFEGYILAGAKKTLQSKPPIVLEFWPYGMMRSGSYPLLKQSLLDVGYQSFSNLENGGSPVRLCERSLDELYEQLGQSRRHTDLLVS
jgi:FkbM family methyltransferase